ncbi:MAG: L,D-transpeptidase family protein [Desulfuromonadales bacterium]|nr:L,D-transpeptidase family protein [Desulfuromonadales bacterium]
MNRTWLLFPAFFLALTPPAHSRLFRETAVLAESPAPLIGVSRTVPVQGGESLIDMAYREGIGFNNLAAANPGIDPWQPATGTEVVLPTSAILPAGAEAGITINLAEFRLYYIWEEGSRRLARSYPIGIGSEGNDTPEGTFKIVRKVKQPTWTAPASIRRERPELPAVVPPGPDNPLGDFWLELSAKGYGIHGTNKPLGVGRRVSHGCIRMYPEDIRDLFQRVQPGTPVRIIFQPIKVGLRDNTLVLEAHADFLEKSDNPLEEVVRQKRALRWRGPIDFSTVMTILRERRGLPLPLLPTPEQRP